MSVSDRLLKALPGCLGLWCAAFALGLTGCASLTAEPDNAAGAASAMHALEDNFAVRGRFSARRDNEAFAARFSWQHAPTSDALDFISPMGATVARLVRDHQTIALYQGDTVSPQQEVQGWEPLTQQAVGFPLPVAALTYWIRGAVAPDAPAHTTLDNIGRIDNLRQHGWTVQYSYADARAVRPDRVEARYGEALELRLKIDGWGGMDKGPEGREEPAGQGRTQ